MTAPLSDETLREMREHLEEAKAAHHTLTEKPTRVGVRVFMALGEIIRAFPRLLDEVERLQKERDDWQRAAHAAGRAADGLQAERDALREALKPFAALSQDHHRGKHDTTPVFAINGAQITYGDLRRAAALLIPEQAEQEKVYEPVTDLMGALKTALDNKAEGKGCSAAALLPTRKD